MAASYEGLVQAGKRGGQRRTALDSVRDAMYTFAPFFVSWKMLSYPSPVLPPVTRITRPASDGQSFWKSKAGLPKTMVAVTLVRAYVAAAAATKGIGDSMMADRKDMAERTDICGYRRLQALVRKLHMVEQRY